MNTQERLEKFGPGPWVDEPDHVEFKAEGFHCLIHRNDMGAWCGYVAVPPGHPWHGKDYNDIDADVHGGLTYAEKCQGEICHVPPPGEPEDVFWLGFDCAHWSDLVPSVQTRYPTTGAGYKDQAYVTRETERLAEQAKAAQ